MTTLNKVFAYSVFELMSDTDIDVADQLFYNEYLPTGDTVITNLSKNE